MKLHCKFIAVFLFAGISAQARENPYDVLGRTLAPFVNLLAKETHSPNRAMSLELRVIEATKLPRELMNASASVNLEYPDKLLLRGPVLGEQVTICRNGQQLWAAPGAKIESLIHGAAGDLPKPKKKYKLTDFELPIPEKQLVFLPVLFQVADAGDETVGDETCRVLEVQLMPQLAQSLGVEEWSARLWVRMDYTPAKLELTGPRWHGVFAFDKVKFAPTLPAETWQPAADQTDVLKLNAAQFKQLLDAAFGGR